MCFETAAVSRRAALVTGAKLRGAEEQLAKVTAQAAKSRVSLLVILASPKGTRTKDTEGEKCAELLRRSSQRATGCAVRCLHKPLLAILDCFHLVTANRGGKWMERL
jgi:hypothetical protein